MLEPIPNVPGTLSAEVAGVIVAVDPGDTHITLCVAGEAVALSSSECAALQMALQAAAKLLQEEVLNGSTPSG